MPGPEPAGEAGVQHVGQAEPSAMFTLQPEAATPHWVQTSALVCGLKAAKAVMALQAG